MLRFVAIFLTLSFFISPFSAFAEEVSPVTLVEIPVYLFTDEAGGFLAIAPITDEIFVWAYAPFVASATCSPDESAMNLHSGSYANPRAATSIGALLLSYDQNGNLTFRAGLEGISHFWDYNNRLIKIEIPVPIFEGGMRMGGFEEIPPTTAYYTYDPAGMRITTNVWGSATTTYPTPYFNTDGTTIKEHVVANGIPVATIEKTTGNPVYFWNNQDHLQSTSVVANSSAQISEEVEYRSFGSIKANTGIHREQRKYTGHEYDNQITTNYTYAKARYLNTDWGRFLSEDMAFIAIGGSQLSRNLRQSAFAGGYISARVNGASDNQAALEAILKDPQALNSYSYARNNPLKYVDQTGELYNFVIGAGLGFVGGLFGQYITDVRAGIAAGQGWGAAFNFSSLENYAVSGGQGLFTGLAIASGGILVGGLVAAGTSIGGDVALGNEINISGAIATGIITAGTAGLVKLAPQVPARLPNLGTRAFFTGAHTQRVAAEEFIETSFQTSFQRPISSALQSIAQQLATIAARLQSILQRLNQ